MRRVGPKTVAAVSDGPPRLIERQFAGAPGSSGGANSPQRLNKTRRSEVRRIDFRPAPMNGSIWSNVLLIVGILASCFASATIISPVMTSDMTEVRRRAEAGDPRAQDMMGEGYFHQFEYASALPWYRKAAEKGVANSQYRLGSMLLSGMTSIKKDMAVEPNTREAVRWFFKAASQKHQLSQVRMGDLFSEGKTVTMNLAEAYKWYARASRSGSVVGRVKLNSIVLSMSPHQIEEGQRSVSQAAKNCEICRQFLDLAPAPTSLELKGIVGFPKKPLALVNDKVLAPGEEVVLSIGRLKVMLKCMEVRERSVLLLVDDYPVELELPE
jgi:hypothetical protein